MCVLTAPQSITRLIPNPPFRKDGLLLTWGGAASQFRKRHEERFGCAVTCLSQSQETFCAVGLYDGTIQLGQLKVETPQHEEETSSVRWHWLSSIVTGVCVLSVRFDGCKVAAGGADGNVRLFDSRGGQLQRTLDAGGSVCSVVFNGPFLMTGSHEGKVRIRSVDRRLPSSSVVQIRVWTFERAELAIKGSEGRNGRM